LTTFLTQHVPVVSAQLEAVISKVVVKEDPIRFLYYNSMNMAIKFSNLVSKEVFTPELILTVNQMHESFDSDPECLEQHMNNSFYWVVGLSSLGREIYLIFPPNYTSVKVDVEKKKILAMYFQNLYI
jgi:Intu longin-like domain 3